jgi:hypothetical protein
MIFTDIRFVGITPTALASIALGLAACGGTGTDSIGSGDGAASTETGADAAPDSGANEAAFDAGTSVEGGGDAGPTFVSCDKPGNVGATGHGCNFVLSPNAVYDAGPINNTLPEVTAPTNASPHGDADPCTRKDPASANTYMTYTYAAGHSLSTNLAYSIDEGAFWNESSSTPAIWPGVNDAPDPYRPDAEATLGVINSETSNLAFRSVPNGVVVFGIHEVYWQAGGKTDPHTKRLELVEAFVGGDSSPSEMQGVLQKAGADTSTVGTLQSYPNISACPGSDCSPGNPPFNLQDALPASTAAGSTSILNSCVWFHEPALHWDESQGKLLLALMCQSSNDPISNMIAVFSTTTPKNDAASMGETGDSSAWTWAYEGSFLSGTEAATAAAAYSLPATNPYFTQGEIATAHDGSLLYLASLVYLNSDKVEVRDAVFVFDVENLAPPKLSAPISSTRGAKPYVAVVQMKLSINGGDKELGPGSSTYDPSLSALGIVYAGRTYPTMNVAAFETDLFSFPTVTP